MAIESFDLWWQHGEKEPKIIEGGISGKRQAAARLRMRAVRDMQSMIGETEKVSDTEYVHRTPNGPDMRFWLTPREVSTL